MQYTLKNINELRVADLKTVMNPTAAVRLIQGQSERGGNSNIINLTDFNVGNNQKSASPNGSDQLSRNVETGNVVVVQSNPMDEDSVLSSVGRLSTNLPEALSLKVKELLLVVRSSSVNRTIPYELVSKEAAISSLAAEQQARAKANLKPVVDPSASRVNNPKENMANAVSTRTTDPYAAENKQVLYYEINVELAGQWPMNSASLFLEKTDEQDRAAARPRADRKLAHRSISRFRNIDNEPRNLYLNIPDKNRSAPIQLLLAEDIAPVEKDTEMDEWDNVLVPVVPMYYTDGAKKKSNAKVYASGYIYIIWQGKLWREVKVDRRGYFRDVDLNAEHQAQNSATQTQELRHIDVSLVDEQYGSYYSLEPFEVWQKGKKVFTGTLDMYGQTRVFGLKEDEVDIKLPKANCTVTVATEKTANVKQKSETIYREANGSPLPHIWLPYKILGEAQQDLYAVYRTKQLTSSQISKLEDNYQDQAKPLAELASYSDMQSFDSDNEFVSALVLPAEADKDPESYKLVNKQVDKNIAAIFLNPLIKGIEFKYHTSDFQQVGSSENQPDDYFELRDSRIKDQTEEQKKQAEEDDEKPLWKQTVSLADCEEIESGIKSICFSSIPGDVKEVDLIRGNKVLGENDEYTFFYIYENVPAAELA